MARIEKMQDMSERERDNYPNNIGISDVTDIFHI